MSFRLTTLIEDHPATSPLLYCEHGLSLWVEAAGHSVLMDTGQTGVFLRNAKALQADLEQTDTIVISHGHYDHAGGLKPLMRHLHNRPEIWIGDGFFRPKCQKNEDGTRRRNGVDFTAGDICQRGFPLYPMTEEHIRLPGDIHLFRSFPATESAAGFCIDEDGCPTDDFRDEIVMGLSLPYGMVVISGCAHRGILSILRTVQERSGQPIAGVIGGTHLLHADQAQMDTVIDTLRTMPLKLLALSHCTGDSQMEQLAQAFPHIFFHNHTGSRILLREDGILWED